jgi:hypothetical protein
VADLKAQKVEALENGEHRKVVEIDDALRELDKEAPKAMQSGNKVAPPVQAQAPNPMQDPVLLNGNPRIVLGSLTLINRLTRTASHNI